METEPDDATRLKHAKLIRVNRPRGDSEAHRTELSQPQSVLVAAALQRMWGQEPVRIRTSGGTAPLYHFIQALGHLLNAVVTMAALLTL